MTNKEKIIAAKTCFDIQLPNNRCQNCPYGYGYLDETGDNSPFWWCDIEKIFDEAIALLKEQEPHIITLNEVIDSLWIGDIIWLEVYYDGETGIEPFLVDIDDISYNTVLVNTRDQYYLSDFGGAKYLEEQVRKSMNSDAVIQKFRFWSSKPTDEYRKAVKWE